MADSLGLLSLPVGEPTVTPPQERDLAPGDPALVQLASFAGTVLQTDVGDAWARLSPGKPHIVGGVDGTRDGDTSARRAWFSDPRRGYFSPEDLPGIFVYRGPQSTSQWMVADAQRLRTQVVIAWVAPPAEEDFQRRERDPFLHAVRASLHVALTQRRHPAWVRDPDREALTALKTSFATSTSPVTITSFNGALAAETLQTPQPITLTTSAAAGAYNTTDPIPVIGILENGLQHTENVFLTDANGGETIKTVFPFVSPVSVALPAMLTTAGAITIGYADSPAVRLGSLIQRACGFREMKFTRSQVVVLQVDQPDETRKPFDGVEFFLDVAEDSAIDVALRAFAPWDVEAHGTRSLPSDDVFEIVIQD